MDDPATPGRTQLRWGGHVLRVSPWQGRADVAAVAPAWSGRAAPLEAVESWTASLRAAGFTRVVTSALAPADQEPFRRAGFVERESLHLLVHDLRAPLPRPGGLSLRRGRRADRPAVLAVDAASFPPDWHLDARSLEDALAATPASRLQVQAPPGRPVEGFAVSGRAGRTGYLQRLAVAPAARGRGIGTGLSLDALRWMRRHGCERAFVNTQVGNDGAVALYLRLGFRLEPQRLAVLVGELDRAAPPGSS